MRLLQAGLASGWGAHRPCKQHHVPYKSTFLAASTMHMSSFKQQRCPERTVIVQVSKDCVLTKSGQQQELCKSLSAAEVQPDCSTWLYLRAAHSGKGATVQVSKGELVSM